MASKVTKDDIELDMDNWSTTAYPPAPIQPSSLSSQSLLPWASSSSSSSFGGPANADILSVATAELNSNEILSHHRHYYIQHQRAFLAHPQVPTGDRMKPPLAPPLSQDKQIGHPSPVENDVVLATTPAAPTTSWLIRHDWTVQSYPPPTFSLPLKKRRPSWTPEESLQEQEQQHQQQLLEQPPAANLETLTTPKSMVEFETTCRNILHNVDLFDPPAKTAATPAAAAVPFRFSRNQSTGSWRSNNAWDALSDSTNAQQQHATTERAVTATRPVFGNGDDGKNALTIPIVRGAAEVAIPKENPTKHRSVLETPNFAAPASHHGDGVDVVPLDLVQICAHAEAWFYQQNHDEVDAFLLEPVDDAPITQVGGPFDVFCLDGKGGGNRYHNEPGNKAFSKLMSAFLPLYLRISTRSKNKVKISPCVVYTIRKLGGRFLKLKEQHETRKPRGGNAVHRSEETETWVDIGNGRAHLKVTRALQRAAKVKRESGETKISKDGMAKEAVTCETTQSSRPKEQTTDEKKGPKHADGRNSKRIILKIPKATVAVPATQHAAPKNVMTAMGFCSSSLSVPDVYSPIPCSPIRPMRRMCLPNPADGTVVPPTATIEDHQSHNKGVGKTRCEDTLVASAGVLGRSIPGAVGSNWKWSVYSEGQVGSTHQIPQNSNHKTKTTRPKAVLNLLSSNISNGGLPAKADGTTKKRAIDTGNAAVVPFPTTKKCKGQEHEIFIGNQCLAIAADGSQCKHMTAVESALLCPYHVLVSGQKQPSACIAKAKDAHQSEEEGRVVNLIASWLVKDAEDDTNNVDVDASDALFAAQCLVRSGFRSVEEILTQIKPKDVAPWPHLSPTVKHRLRNKLEAFAILKASSKSRIQQETKEFAIGKKN